ncbi:MAG: hypothetical protein ACXVCO_05230 [Ktedonobacterales bacterium]
MKVAMAPTAFACYRPLKNRWTSIATNTPSMTMPTTGALAATRPVRGARTPHPRCSARLLLAQCRGDDRL